MCTPDGDARGSAAEALRMVSAGLDYLNGPDAADLPAAALGEVLTSLGELQAKFAVAQAAFLRRFDAVDAHDADGYPTSASWLAAMTGGQISPFWAGEIARWTKPLPAELRGETEQILLEAAAAGADLTTCASWPPAPWSGCCTPMRVRLGVAAEARAGDAG
jgi:hypothetical protein